jgi:glutamate synthase domain-containing protein 2
MLPIHNDPKTLKTVVGGKDRLKPYEASILNISAMSYGSLRKNAILALNGGTQDGSPSLQYLGKLARVFRIL